MNFKKLREHSNKLHWFLLDVVMIVLAMLYVLWSVLDFLFRTMVVARLTEQYAPEWGLDFYKAYTSFDSIFYDSIFVSVFVLELLLRWGVAIYRKTYHRWFFYPFVHWYDTIGCIPFGAFKLFRMLRVFFTAYRLHQLGVINLEGNFFYDNIQKYSKVLIEEISDRVVISIIGGVQREVSEGTPLAERIILDVVLPQKHLLVNWISKRVQQAAVNAREAYENDIRLYVQRTIKEAVKQNEEIGNIERIPLVGSNLGSRLERAISDIVFNVINQALEDLASPQNKKVVEEVSEIAIATVLTHDDDEQLTALMQHLVIQSLEMVKAQMRVQHWKQAEI
jgi:hypothetical protein